jgi:hypothetical protein
MAAKTFAAGSQNILVGKEFTSANVENDVTEL